MCYVLIVEYYKSVDNNNNNSSTSGNYGVKVTHLPIPNRIVKLHSADGTALETVWESKTLPGNMIH